MKKIISIMKNLSIFRCSLEEFFQRNFGGEIEPTRDKQGK